MKTPPPPLTLCGEEVHMVADNLLHGAFEGLVGGGDGQEEMFGGGIPLWEEPLVTPDFPSWSACSLFLILLLLLLLLSFWWGGDDGMEEGNGGRREEAGCGELVSFCDETKKVLQGDGAPPN